jgi:hypothetical protein
MKWARTVCPATHCRGLVAPGHGELRFGARPRGEAWSHDYLDMEALACPPALLHAPGIDALHETPSLFWQSNGETDHDRLD